MRKLPFLILPLALILTILVGCIEEFTPEGINQAQGTLVVDGTITPEYSLFKLSRTIGIEDTFQLHRNIITDANLYVEASDGEVFPGIVTEDGLYSCHVGDLSSQLEYRLCFTLDGQHYQSTFLSPIFTSEIDSLGFSQQALWPMPVNVEVSTHGNGENPYYLWSYREDWEVTADYFADIGYFDKPYMEPLNQDRNTYYCWGRDSSFSINLGSTEAYLEDVIRRNPIRRIACYDDRLSTLYHIQVYQRQLHKECYDFLREMEESVSHTGGIFSPTLTSSNRGNVENLDDKKELVIGFVDVATITTSDIYIDRSQILFEEADKCQLYFVEDTSEPPVEEDIVWVSYQNSYVRTWLCTDCRLKEKASKNKPQWWPTNHK